MKKTKIQFEHQGDFGILCICALRYCMGRQTYMPHTVRDIIRPLLPMLSDHDIGIMLNDCKLQAECDMFGDEKIDKPGWITWEKELLQEHMRRSREHAQQS